MQFILKNNSKKSFYFASLQSETASSLNLNDLSSIIYKKEEDLFYKSDAVIEILLQLDGAYPKLAFIIKLVPKRGRDFIYDQIARFRYDLFGKQDRCYLPVGSDEHLFLS